MTVQGDPGAVMHTSWKDFYKKVDPLVRVVEKGSSVHRSVIDRMMIPDLSSPNVEREPTGQYRPVQFNDCLNGRPPSLEVMSQCYQVVDD